jgi:hypothetical protein
MFGFRLWKWMSWIPLNFALARLQLPPLTEAQVGDFVGNGIHKLVERALRETIGGDPADGLIQDGVLLFREEYGAHLLDNMRLYTSPFKVAS